MNQKINQVTQVSQVSGKSGSSGRLLAPRYEPHFLSKFTDNCVKSPVDVARGMVKLRPYQTCAISSGQKHNSYQIHCPASCHFPKDQCHHEECHARTKIHLWPHGNLEPRSKEFSHHMLASQKRRYIYIHTNESDIRWWPAPTNMCAHRSCNTFIFY